MAGLRSLQVPMAAAVRCALGLALLLAVASPARAQQTPEELVRWIYLSRLAPGPAETTGLAYLSAPPQRRQFFTARMADFFDANDIRGEDGNDLVTACVDFAFDIPGNDFDAREIAATLVTATTGDATRQRVTATFRTFGSPAAISYDFVPDGGSWKIDDITGPGWQVSHIPCALPGKAAPAAPVVTATATAYCYRTDSDRLRLDVAADGTARFSVDSVQTNAHLCGAEGVAGPAAGGWLYRETTYDPACRLGFQVTAEGGIRITDDNDLCKAFMCGHRAFLDGLTFPRASQIDCARLGDEPAR